VAIRGTVIIGPIDRFAPVLAVDVTRKVPIQGSAGTSDGRRRGLGYETKTILVDFLKEE